MQHPPIDRYVLEGRVATMGPAGVLEDGAIYVDAQMIEAVQDAGHPVPDAKYDDAPRIRTGDTIFPGFIELHNHLSYNAMSLWDVPTLYTNNGQWRGTEPYTRQITKPSQVLGQTDGAAQALIRYAECRALLGGTTTSQGITLANAGGARKYYAGLVRNAEAPDDPRLPKAGTNIANPETNDPQGYLRKLSENTCYLQHLSEGTDDTARGWFQRLQIDATTWAVNDVLCAIHCAALDRDDFWTLAGRGATMVWSPLSNYLLYGATADMSAARASGISISLGSDWAPSGTKNLLGELKVAWLSAREQGDVFSPRELVEMVTINPARALKWDTMLGSIEPGKLADLVAINGRTEDPYESLIRAKETSVTLVLVAGVPRVGQPRLMRRFWTESLGDADWIDRTSIGRSSRYLFFEHDADILDGLSLSTAQDTLATAMQDLPALAEQVDAAVGAGNAITDDGSVVFADGMAVGADRLRVVPDFEQEDNRQLIKVLGLNAASQPYSFWVTDPMQLDPITVVDDKEHLPTLVRSRNLPEFLKRGLPELYGQSIRLPHSASFLDQAGDQVDRRVVDTTTDLSTVLSSFGELTLDDRKLIVEQAIVLLSENYAHLPLKRAMHAVDPVQRLRLLRQRLDRQSPATMPPEIDFHAEVMEIFTSIRDLHTSYRLPAPFGTKVAWLPFLLEEVWDRGHPSYVLTKWVADGWPDPTMEGATVTHWNGTPVATAITRNAERNAGSNSDARHARGLNSLTIRPLSVGLPPDEDWITLRWTGPDGQPHFHTQEWLVFEPGDAVGPGQLLAESSALGLDSLTDDIQQARKILYAPAVATAERRETAQVLAKPISSGAQTIDTVMPGVFRAMEIHRSGSNDADPGYGYIRIFTFNVSSAETFVQEFVRLAGLLPDRGLIIDVRGNGGGLIYAAEELLQVLTPRRIDPEPAQFINTALNLKICRNHRDSTALPGLSLEAWIDSIAESTQTGATYSRGVPITAIEQANQRGQQYFGPVTLITDALCYSATDIFAAGFQDHEIGTVIGVGGATGAGGANVWTHALLRRLMEPDNQDPGPSPYAPLPRGADLRVAVRRTTRVGPNAGNILEDLGVTPDVRYQMSRNDVLGHNQDLIDTAADSLANRRTHSLSVSRVQRHRDRAPTVHVQTHNLTRVDAEVDGRRLATRNVKRNHVALPLDEAVPQAAGRVLELHLQGYDGDTLAAARRTTITV